MAISSKRKRAYGIMLRQYRQWFVPPLLVIGLGALAACGFRPLALWPAMVLGVAGLLFLVDRQPGYLRAALIGWLWGVGHFSLGNNWIATAFTYQAKMPEWLGFLAVLLLSFYLAVYPALAAMAAWLASRRLGAALVPAFAGCWIVSEWLRAWLFTGFAWNPLGVALLGDFGHAGLAALSRWLGTYGLSGLAVLLSGGAYIGLKELLLPGGISRQGASWLAVPVVVLGAAMVLPAARVPEKGHVPYTLVQPNIPQADLDDPSHYEEQFVKTARLSAPLHPGQRRLLLWPESGVPVLLRADHFCRRCLAGAGAAGAGDGQWRHFANRLG